MATAQPSTPAPKPTARQRWRALRQLEQWLETPMLVLSFVWLALLVIEAAWGSFRAFQWLGSAIWAVFIADFALRLTLAPSRLRFLRGNWLTAVSLLVPALRLFRFARFLRVARVAHGTSLVKIVGSVNRGMNALRRTLGRRRAGYATALTILVVLLGAAGELAVEPHGATAESSGFSNYADALWWTAMIITSIGSQYWPQTPEGRVLCVLLSLYGFAVFGYITATLATFFIGRDAEDEAAPIAGERELAALRREIAALRAELRAGMGGAAAEPRPGAPTLP